MQEERLRVLEMLSRQKITVEEADRLLRALEGSGVEGDREKEREVQPKAKPKSLRIVVEPKGEQGGKKEHVNIRIPLILVRAGVKIGNVLPGHSKDKINEALAEKGISIDVNKMDSESLEELLEGLSATSIDVDDEKETIRIFCE